MVAPWRRPFAVFIQMLSWSHSHVHHGWHGIATSSVISDPEFVLCSQQNTRYVDLTVPYLCAAKDGVL
jgi:hypothetical protein